jgi:hypothetical protein
MNSSMTRLLGAALLALAVAPASAGEQYESRDSGFYTNFWEGRLMVTPAPPVTYSYSPAAPTSRGVNVSAFIRATPKQVAQNMLWLDGLTGTHEYEGELISADGDPVPLQLTIACAKETSVAMRCLRVRDAGGGTDVDFLPERMQITYDRALNQLSYQPNDGEGRRDTVTSRVRKDGTAEFREKCPEELGSRCKRITRISVGPDGLSQRVEIRVHGRTVSAVEVTADDSL